MKYVFPALVLVVLFLATACKTSKTAVTTTPPEAIPPETFGADIMDAPPAPRTAPPPYKRTSTSIIEGLDLDEEQVDHFNEIQMRYQQEMQEMRSAGANRPGMMEEMKKMRASQDKEIEKIMTKEQFAAYKERIAERMDRRKK